MRLLVLGGTAWLGGCVATTALERGHRVTCLARGSSGPAPAGATFVRADRDRPQAYDEVVREQWDVVVDVSRQPGQVRRAVTALAPRSSSYVFISSGNVYADHSDVGADESSALLPPLDGDVMQDMETYGQAKVACEQHVLAAFGASRSLCARVGLIGGPGDVSDRSGYWPLRFARPVGPSGRVLVPDVPDLATGSSTYGTSRRGSPRAVDAGEAGSSTSWVRPCHCQHISRSHAPSPATWGRWPRPVRSGWWSTGSSRGWGSAPCRCGCRHRSTPASTPATAARLERPGS